MKFVIKSGSTVKLFSGDLKIEALAQFLKENFTSWNSNNLTYTDKDGDRITITTQEDLDALIAMSPTSQYAKLEISEETSEEKTESLNQTREPLQTESNQIVSEVQEKSEDKISRKKSLKEKKSKSKSPKKWHDKKWREEKLKNRRSPSCKDQKPSTSSEDSRPQSHKKDRLQKLEGLINEKVAEMVDQRIKNLIPCLKNQLSESFEVSVVNQNDQLKHEGVTCNGCNMSPIVGIRYKCLECSTFNFCSCCEQKIEHEHNLLKMKKAEEKSQRKEKNCGLWKVGKHLIREMKHKETSQESDNEGHRHKHRHCRGKRRSHKGDFMEHRINKRLFKLRAVFGEQANFREFIQKYSDLKPKELLDVYAAQNDISPEEYQEKRNQMRKAKLAAFYDRPEEEFDEVVKNHPKLSFREIIMNLKETGERVYTGENFKRMREKFRKCPVEDACELKTESKFEKKSNSKSKEPKREHSKEKESRKKEKERILNSMKSLFGEQKTHDYRKFIEENFELNEEETIAKWIEKVTK